MRSKRVKTAVIIALAAVTFLILAAVSGAYFLFRRELATISTIDKLQDGLYTMEYTGDYGFQAFLDAGGAANSGELARYLSGYISKGFYTYELSEEAYGCSTISAASPSGGRLFGRNFDWQDCTCMVVFTAPPDGHKSISTVNLNFLGYGESYQPDSLVRSFLALGAAYAPLDGMNEAGLCVADLVIPDAGETHQDTGKPDLTTTTAIRLILDRAATVDEAVALLDQYDIHSDIGTMHHLAIADAAGKSVAVEFIDGTLVVSETDVVTNHFIAGAQPGGDSSHERFALLQNLLDAYGGVLRADEVREGLQAVAQSKGYERDWRTQWSVVFDQSTLRAALYYNENYSQPIELAIR